MNILAKLQVGSHLYGTNVEGSDVDLRSIYLPSLTDCMLDRIKHAYEVPEGEDTSVFSLQHFCKLALEGQSIAIEMLSIPLWVGSYQTNDHRQNPMVVSSSPVWEALHKNRNRFYTKSMKSFLGYAKTQAGKYSARVDRLGEVEVILAYLNGVMGGLIPKLSGVWDGLPQSVNAVKTENLANKHADKRVYVVCGRELQATVHVDHAIDVITRIRDSYGERVRKAKDGIVEWKSFAHAFRVALQAKELATTGDLVFPLKDAEWLRDVRLGKIDFHANSLDKRLDDLIAEVQGLMDASDLPDKPDVEWVEGLICHTYAQEMRMPLLDVRAEEGAQPCPPIWVYTGGGRQPTKLAP